MSASIYLDYQATTPCAEEVVQAMLPLFAGRFGNAASRQHEFGRAASARVERARASIASLIGADDRGITFTSGATESINLALKGVAESPAHSSRKHIITCQTEHKAVLNVSSALEARGFRVTYLPVAPDGTLTAASVKEAIEDDTLLVSLMLANNEIGTVHPIDEIGAICHECGVLLHCDAVQGLGFLDCDVSRLNVDLLSLSSHKIYGPQGVGALWTRRRPRVRLAAQIDGGGHERGLRSGTLNLPGIVGFGVAADLVRERRETDARRAATLRDRLHDGLVRRHPQLIVNGTLDRRLPCNLNVTIPGARASDVLRELSGVAIASGSACSSAGTDGSYVLRALGNARASELGGLRLSVGRPTSESEVDRAVTAIANAVDSAIESPGSEDECGVACD